MMIADLDPWWADPPRRAALAGLAKLSELDGAERLVGQVRDESLPPEERISALGLLHQLNPALWTAAASRLVTDRAESVRRAARSAVNAVRADESPP
jgi:hypothetical protein